MCRIEREVVVHKTRKRQGILASEAKNIKTAKAKDAAKLPVVTPKHSMYAMGFPMLILSSTNHSRPSSGFSHLRCSSHHIVHHHIITFIEGMWSPIPPISNLVDLEGGVD